MRMKILAIAACALFAVTSAAMADTHVGWYVAADAGGHQGSSQHLAVTDVAIESSTSSESSSSSSSPSGSPALHEVTSPDAYTGPYSLKTRNGSAIFVRGGYQFSPNWRAELELGQRAAKINHSIASGAYTDTEARGSQDVDTAMVNVIYDIAPASSLHPFLGLGAGAVRIKTNYNGNVTPTGNAYVTQSYAIHSSKTVAGYQGVAGLTWAVSDHLNLDLTYRYLQASKVSYNVGVVRKYYSDVDDGGEDAPKTATAARVMRAPNAAVVQTGEVIERDRMSGRFHDQSLTLGLRWTFGAPPAPAPVPVVYGAAPPAPMPAAPDVPKPQVVTLNPEAPSGHYTVYFPFDSTVIDATGQAVMRDAADYAQSLPSAHVAVAGHTDTSGSAAYNIQLSEKRAKMVADGLIGMGVPASAVSVTWKGETDLQVMTGNGVKQPENRRATIDVE